MTLHQHAAEITIRNGVEFTLLLIEPGMWRWRFQIGELATTGTTKTNLRGWQLAELERAVANVFSPATASCLFPFNWAAPVRAVTWYPFRFASNSDTARRIRQILKGANKRHPV